jgi:dephospho-CoA kinase
MKIIGIAGGIASGKSTIAGIFAEQGVKIIDADAIGFDIVQPQKKAWREIVKAFGRDILEKDGTINRKKLGALVFSDAKALQKLNEITHPLIIENIKERIEKHKKNREELVIVDAALLGAFEEKIPLVDIFIVAVADKDTQRKRLFSRDKLSLQEADMRISSQTDILKKIKRIDYTLDTSKPLRETREDIRKIIDELSAKDRKR